METSIQLEERRRWLFSNSVMYRLWTLFRKDPKSKRRWITNFIWRNELGRERVWNEIRELREENKELSKSAEKLKEFFKK